MTIAKQSLLEAAKAVVENWYQNKAVVDSIDALRQAVAEAEREKGLSEWVKFERSSKAVTNHIEDSLGMVYTPMTDDEFQAIYGDDYLPSFAVIERAVIERLGLRWPE